MIEELAAKLATIKEHLAEYFERAEKEENEKIAALFSALKAALLEKQERISVLEAEISAGALRHDEEREKLELTLSGLISALSDGLPDYPKTPMPETDEEAVNAASAYKRRKHNINYKINNLKRILMQKIKENNDAINEENRGFKNREAELLRRQNIDLQRALANNIKEYSGLEKKLLDINDAREIIEAKKTIKRIRIVGLKEQMNIKNRYAQLLYQNTIEYRRVYERMMLNHALINEEFDLKIKALEAERGEIEAQEARDEAIAKLEMQKRLLEWEKENELARLKSLNDIARQVVAMKKEIAASAGKKTEYLKESLTAAEKEVHAFDGSQLSAYGVGEKFQTEQLRATCDLLVTQWFTLSELFYRLIKSLVSEKYKRRFRMVNAVGEYLLTGTSDRFPRSGHDYKALNAKISRLLTDFIAREEELRGKFFQALDQQFTVVTTGIKDFLKTIAEGINAEEKLLSEFMAGYAETLALDERDAAAANEKRAVAERAAQARLVQNAEAEVAESDRRYAETVRKTVADYRARVLALDAEIKKLRSDTKAEIARIQQEYAVFKKQSRNRETAHKTNYHHIIVQQEKTLYKQYREKLEENELERQRKIKTL